MIAHPTRVDPLRTTLVCANTVRRRGLLAEHGLAVWVEAGSATLLWDTGQGRALLPNVEVLGLSFEALDAVVLSHGHYDHTGGLDQLPERGRPYRLLAHPGSLAPKFQEKAGRADRAGCPPAENGAAALGPRFRFEAVTQPMEIANGVWLTGEIPRRHPIEDTGGAFFLDEGLRHEDPLLDDLACLLATSKGWVVLLGCAHAGVIQTLEAAEALAPELPIRAVLGGMHLLHASRERLTWTMEHLERRGPPELYPIHCTGDAATRALFQHFPRSCHDWHVGESLTF